MQATIAWQQLQPRLNCECSARTFARNGATPLLFGSSAALMPHHTLQGLRVTRLQSLDASGCFEKQAGDVQQASKSAKAMHAQEMVPS